MSFARRIQAGWRAAAALLTVGLAVGIGLGTVHGDPDKTEAFLAMIEGNWAGQAEVTPVGPRPYDMVLARTPSGRVEGAAHPGRSIHTWTFFAEDGDLQLSFLTTFGGNQHLFDDFRDPIPFQPAQWTGDWATFRALRPEYLEVRIRPDSKTLAIDVFLRSEERRVGKEC